MVFGQENFALSGLWPSDEQAVKVSEPSMGIGLRTIWLARGQDGYTLAQACWSRVCRG